MEIGKLYKCSKYYLLIYPSIEKIRAASSLSAAWTPAAAAYWSEQLSCKVRCSEPDEIFMCLEQENQFIHALFGEKQGWIINEEWLKIERVK